MEAKFSGKEIIQMGIEIEKNGKSFYANISLKSKKKEVKEVFEFLAKQEDKHIKIFEKILSKFESNKLEGLFTEEYYAYMKSLASGYIFTEANSVDKVLKQVKDELMAVDLAINFEKESILFYEGMRSIIAKQELSVVDSLITQEKSHLLRVTNIKKTFK